MPSCRISKSAGSSDLDKQAFRQVRPLHLSNRFSPAIRSSRKLSHGEHAHTVNPHLRIEMWGTRHPEWWGHYLVCSETHPTDEKVT